MFIFTIPIIIIITIIIIIALHGTTYGGELAVAVEREARGDQVEAGGRAGGRTIRIHDYTTMLMIMVNTQTATPILVQ